MLRRCVLLLDGVPPPTACALAVPWREMAPRRQRLGAVAAHVAPALSGVSAVQTAAAPQPFVGNGQQGFGIRAKAQPPVFDPRTQHAEAYRFWEENRYVVVQALSASEVREMNEIADRGWLRDYAHVPSELMVFYPLLDYPAVDKFINHPTTMPLISQMLGGWEHVRFQEFNWRYYPENYGVPADGGPAPPGSHGMRFHPDASLPDRFSRQPYGPPDYVSAFYCKLPLVSPNYAFSIDVCACIPRRPDRHTSAVSVFLRGAEVNSI